MLDNPPGSANTTPVPDGPRGPASRQHSHAPELTIRVAASALRRRKLPFLVCVLFIPLCALIALRQVTPRYTASGTLIYEPSEYKVRELQSILRADPTTEAVMASQAEILHSLHIAQRVAERGNLFANPEFNRALRPPSLWARAVALLVEAPEPAAPPPGPVLDAARNATLRTVQDALHASALHFSRVIEVTFTAEDPVVAAAAVNNAMDVYVKDQYSAKQRMVRHATEWLDRRANDLRTEVRAAENAVAAYRAANRLAEGMHAGIDAEQISHLSEDLVRARGDLANAAARLDAARGRAGAAAQAAIAPSVVQLRVQQDQFAAQLQAQQGRLGQAHPVVDALRRQAAEAQRGVTAEIARVVSATEAEQRAAAERVATLEANLATAQREVDRISQAHIQLNALVRDAEAARAQLLAMLERLQQTAQQAAIETSEAHEISQALPPEFPSYPRTVPMLAAAGASGVLLGLLLVYLLHLADTTAQSGNDVRATTGLPCFALLPEVSRRALGHLRIEDYVARRPLTAFAEQVRALRAGLWFGAHRPRMIAVTAARPGEGKTIATLALGRSARLSGERVMLVECDLRQPSFARRLHAEGSSGLSDILKGQAVLEDVVRTDPLTGLSYLPAGKPGGDVLGLFMSEPMGRLLATLRQDYDLVLLDAPPVQAMTEARVVSALADATLLCVRWRSTPRAVLRNALDLLEEAHAHVVGTVLTRVDPRAHLRSGFADAEVYHRRYTPYYRR